jgi:acyl-CoA thioesterase-1
MEATMKTMIAVGLAIGLMLAGMAGQSAAAPGNGLKVYNKGIGGQNSKGGRARFAKDVLALKPQYVFIYFGLNDTLNEPAFQTCEQYIDNLTWMVEAARQAGIEPVLCTIHHVTEAPLYRRHKKESYGSEGPNGKIDRYNKALRALATEKKVKLVDFGAAVDREGKAGKTEAAAKKENHKIVSRDGVHLTPAGYALLARCFFETVRGELKGGETIVCLGDSVTFGTGVKGPGTVTGENYPSVLARLPLK